MVLTLHSVVVRVAPHVDRVRGAADLATPSNGVSPHN